MKRKNYGFIVVLLLLVTVGYAYLSTTLTINGTAKFKKNDWSIVWEDVQVLNDSITISAEEQTEEGGGYFGARIKDGDATTIEYKIPLKLPRDKYHFTAYMANNGSVDAMITEEGVKKLVPELSNEEAKYMEYDVKYADGTEIKPFDGLRAHERRQVEVIIRYKDDLEATDLPGADTPKALTSTFDFIQADKTKADYIRLAPVGTPTSTNTDATEVSAPVVNEKLTTVNATLDTDASIYTVTVTYKNTGANTIKYKGITPVDLNEGVEVEVLNSSDTALAVDTEVAAGESIQVTYKFTVASGTTVNTDTGLALNAPGKTAKVKINFAE